MKTTLAACLATALGVGLGLLLTTAATRTSTIGMIRAGPWRFSPDAGSPSVNPYQRAHLARTGEIPLAVQQGVTVVAREDSRGQTLDGRCVYRLSGPVPAARFWTLEAATTTGRPFANPAGREAFTSADVLRDGSGQFAIILGPTVQPGNWLPLPGAGHPELVLRLYATDLAGPGSPATLRAAFPTIDRIACAS